MTVLWLDKIIVYDDSSGYCLTHFLHIDIGSYSYSFLIISQLILENKFTTTAAIWATVMTHLQDCISVQCGDNGTHSMRSRAHMLRFKTLYQMLASGCRTSYAPINLGSIFSLVVKCLHSFFLPPHRTRRGCENGRTGLNMLGDVKSTSNNH